MKPALLFILSLCSWSLFAQKEIFDLLTYVPPKGWTKNTKNTVVTYTTAAKDGGWCQIAVYQSTASKGNVDADFSSEWNELVVKPYKASAPQNDSVATADGWKVKSGAGSFIFNNANAMAVLTSFSGFHKCLSIVATTNQQKYFTNISAFLDDLDLKKPVASTVTNTIVNTTPPSQPTAGIADDYKFNTSNFDDGWTSTIQPDWVEVSKDDVKVLIHFNGIPGEQYESDRRVTEKKGWDNIIVPRYTNLTNYEYLSYNMNYISELMMAGNLVDKSGKQVFVVLFRSGGRENSWLEFIFPNRQRFTQVFGIDKYDGYTKWNALSKMMGYNRFAVALSDLKGAWTNSFTGMTQYVYAYSGMSAGATANSSAQGYVFDGAGNYNWTINVAGGVVGNMKFQNAKSAGKATMTNNWQMHLSNIENKPRDYPVYFSGVKGARVLWIDGQAFVRKQ